MKCYLIGRPGEKRCMLVRPGYEKYYAFAKSTEGFVWREVELPDNPTKKVIEAKWQEISSDLLNGKLWYVAYKKIGKKDGKLITVNHMCRVVADDAEAAVIEAFDAHCGGFDYCVVDAPEGEWNADY